MDKNKDFDWISYVNNYEDLQKSKINTKEKAWLHWQLYGINEGRTFNKIKNNTDENNVISDNKNDRFNWRAYVNNYLDLQQANINTEEKAFSHWMIYGTKENRTFNDLSKIKYINENENYENFDWTRHNQHYRITTNSKEESWKHWLAYAKRDNGHFFKKNNNVDKKTIVHILHNFGGGTKIYVDNLCNILHKNYDHIIIKILSENMYSINNVLYDDKKLSIFLLTINLSLVIVHHLLFLKNNLLFINNYIISLIFEFKCNKIFVVHDYFLFNENNPNPIKKKFTGVAEKNILFAQNLLKKFDSVFFNSVNAYGNYKKYIQISNYRILNCVPDIDIYSDRIYPNKKNKITICLLGVLDVYHKGTLLASSIFELFENNPEYNFVVIGTYNRTHKNVFVHGRYNNHDIYKLIKLYKIDCFLFVSIFEETYSFTLSIALNTGLPIIYNNIGAYKDRLECYKNCFFYEEENIEKIKNILYTIKQKSKENKSIILPEYNLYMNLPEFEDYVTIDKELNFDLTNIKSHLLNKNVCFIHFTNVNNGKDIFMDQINSIKKSCLYKKLDYIFVVLLGEHIYLPQDYKIKLIYYSRDVTEWEFPSIMRIKHFADNINDNINILYLHTKGVLNKPNSYEWRKYLEYFLVEKYEYCLNALQYYKCVGVNQQFYFDQVNKYRNHFSGNFWWSSSNYIKNLPKIFVNSDRYVTEHYLIGNLEKNDYRNFLSLHHTKYNLYEHPIKCEEYNIETIKRNTLTKINSNFIKTRKIYGLYFICCIGNYYDVVTEQITKLVDSGLYDLTDEVVCYVCLCNDEIIDHLKQFQKIKIFSTNENLYEKYAINNYKKYLTGEYYLYYFHSKSVTRTEKCYTDWRHFCEYFTIIKWRLSLELLNYYDCVGTNLRNFPKMHYSGNFWWSKSEHLNMLKNIDDNYLSPEMYVCSYPKTNKISIFESNVTHGNTIYPENLYINYTNEEIIEKINMIPIFNNGDKHL